MSDRLSSAKIQAPWRTRLVVGFLFAGWLMLPHGAHEAGLLTEGWDVWAAELDPTVETQTERTFSDEQLEFFEKQVRPLLVEHCFSCHGGEGEESTRGGLRLDSRQGVLAGGDTGPGADPGNPRDSSIIDAIQYGDLYQMPPKSKLRDAEIEVLTRWVEMGLPWPASERPRGGNDQATQFDVQARKEAHWAWKPLARPALPTVKQDSWVRDPIDRFILAKLEAEDLTPAPPASPHTLIRRLHFDLVGLPPSPTEVRDFLENPSPTAYAEAVDRLLDSPQFGERWARHWLDLVRYAESRGHEFDYDVANAHQYRDYVIRALNADVPYNQWMVEHIAGDLIKDPRRHPEEGYNESILGTGFWFLGEWIHSPVDIRMDECDRFDNMLDVFSKTFLGLTVACARCHDHKFDAIPQSDYYALFGILQSSGYRQATFDTMDNHRDIAEQLEQLEHDYRLLVGELISKDRNALLPGLAEYLLVAREGLLQVGQAALETDLDADPEVKPVSEWSDEARQVFAKLAGERGLRQELLEQWARHLWMARHDSTDPFSLWGLSALQPDDRGWDVRSAVKKWIERISPGGAISGPASQPLTAARSESDDRRPAAFDQAMVLDFRDGRRGQFEDTSSTPSTWLSDGYAFGLGPAEAGQLELTSEKEGAVQFRILGAARRDPFWRSLGLAEQVTTESGRLGNWPRSGQTIRTPAFLVNHGPVHYLVRGSGVAYAAVNSHAMFAGPLHGRLVKEFKHPDPGQLHWVTHDLTRYRGHRAHVEFHPLDEELFEVVMVVQSEQIPDLPTFVPATAMVPRLASRDGDSADGFSSDKAAPPTPARTDTAEEAERASVGVASEWRDVATAYQRMFIELQADFQQGRLRENSDIPISDRAALANWYLKHMELFGGEDVTKRLEELRGEYFAKREQLRSSVKWKSRTAPAMWEGTGMDERLMVRGNPRTLGQPVPRRFLTAIAGEEQTAITSGSGRDRLARWLVDPANPFPSRVMVNRVWHHLTGRGIVASTDNFGVLGEEPTHPELLDHLARRFIDDGWSVKRLIRRVVLSNTYQMSSTPRPEVEARDPEVLLLHRMRIRRLQGEAIRDTLLKLAGRLDPKLHGPSIPVHLTAFMQGRGRPAQSGPLDGEGRRSVYIAVRRNFLSPMMLAFDTPQPFSSVGRRNASNVPAQALILMNDPLVIELSRQWAERILAERPRSVDDAVRQMYWQAFSRPPSEVELAAARSFLEVDGSGGESESENGNGNESKSKNETTGPSAMLEWEQGWADYAHVLMNVKELILVE